MNAQYVVIHELVVNRSLYLLKLDDSMTYSPVAVVLFLSVLESARGECWWNLWVVLTLCDLVQLSRRRFFEVASPLPFISRT